MRDWRRAVLTVSNSTDHGPGSLREAITQANELRKAVRIEFAIESGPATIRPTSPLPPITFRGVIDGWTQPGVDGRPGVEIDGTDSSPGAGLEIAGSGLTLRGLAVTNWSEEGIVVHDCDEVRLLGLCVGVRPDGATPAGNGGSGVRVTHVEHGTIGGPGEAAVVASGNVGHGILVQFGAHFRLQGAFLGTDGAGRVAVPNGLSGIKLHDSYGAVLGGLDDGTGNVVSGNARYGVEIGGIGSAATVVIGNYLGTDATGSTAIPNARDGIVVHSSPGVRIGGPSPRERNVIAGNNLYGVEIIAPDAKGALVLGNYVGVDASGSFAIPNGRSGVLIYNTSHARIGGPSPGEGNVISGGERGGVNLDGSVREGYDWTGVGRAHSNLVQGNLIGLDATGEHPIGNKLRGVLVNHTQDNTIVDNVISANRQDGILILGPEDDSDPNLTPSGNLVARNRIGVTASGKPCGNGRHGVFVRHGKKNQIGGNTADDGNVIAANEARGVMFSGVGATSNVLGPSNEIYDNVLGPFHQREG